MSIKNEITMLSESSPHVVYVHTIILLKKTLCALSEIWIWRKNHLNPWKKMAFYKKSGLVDLAGFTSEVFIYF